MRRFTTLIVALETFIAVAVVAYCIAVGDALKAQSKDREAVVFVTGLFAFTTVPAAALVISGRWLWLAAILTGLPVLAVAYRLTYT